MTVKLDSKSKRMVEDHIRGGKYSSAEDVVRAGLAALRQQERVGEFVAGELDELIAEGEKSLRNGKARPARKVFRELQQRTPQRRSRKSA
jgi:putative addiction module CopG family antidote